MEDQTGCGPPAIEQLLDGLASLPDAVVLVDEAGRPTYSNVAAQQLFGPEGLSGQVSSWPQAHGLYPQGGRTPWEPDSFPPLRALRGEASTDVELCVRNRLFPDGCLLYVTSIPIRSAQGVSNGVICVFRRARRTAQQSVRLDAERHRRAILDNIQDLAWLKDLDGRFIDVNQRHSELYSRPREMWVGLTDNDVYPPAMAAKFRADDQEVVQSRSRRVVEECVVDAEGNERWLETIKMPILGDDGGVMGTTGTARDITQRRRERELLRTLNEELERRVLERTRALEDAQQNLLRRERLAFLGQLAGSVAHQVRNPLGTILNAATLLESVGSLSHETASEAVHLIQEEIRRANAIITSLLDFARARAPLRRPVFLDELVERTLQSERIPSSVRIFSRFEGAQRVLADPDLLQSAIGNLIRNAVEAMPEGGELRLEGTAHGDGVLLAVSDSGPGIAPKIRERLFEPLHSTKPSGVGLGLVTVRMIVEAHGGSVTCAEASNGARFEVRLPREVDERVG